jgi:rRNA small subunit pseudouridine methyltransferase Nep1
MSSEETPVRLSTYLQSLPQDQTLVFFIGAMSHGKDDWVDDIVDDKICISDYPLSAAVTCSKLTCALEDIWNVL